MCIHILIYVYIQVYILLGTDLCLSLVAGLLLALCLDKLSMNHTGSHNTQEQPGGHGSAFSLLLATALHWKDRRQVLLIPLTVFLGLEQAFVASDYTRVFCLILILGLLIPHDQFSIRGLMKFQR